MALIPLINAFLSGDIFCLVALKVWHPIFHLPCDMESLGFEA